MEKLLTSKNEDQDLILVSVPKLEPELTSVAEVAIPLSSWQDNNFFYTGFVLHSVSKDSQSRWNLYLILSNSIVGNLCKSLLN